MYTWVRLEPRTINWQCHHFSPTITILVTNLTRQRQMKISNMSNSRRLFPALLTRSTASESYLWLVYILKSYFFLLHFGIYVSALKTLQNSVIIKMCYFQCCLRKYISVELLAFMLCLWWRIKHYYLSWFPQKMLASVCTNTGWLFFIPETVITNDISASINIQYSQVPIHSVCTLQCVYLPSANTLLALI